MTSICFDNAQPASLDDAIAAHVLQSEELDADGVRKVRSGDICRCTCIQIADVIPDARAACGCDEAGR